MKIGEVELPIVSDVETQEEAEVSEIKDAFKKLDSVPVKHQPEVETITISGFVNKEMHSSNTSISQQKSQIKSLRKKDILENNFTYKDWQGHLLVENVNFSDNDDSRIINDVEIEARYFPWPKYFKDSKP